MNFKKNWFSINIHLLILFACTDIYLISGIKLVYIFVVPVIIYLYYNRPLLAKEDYFLLLWYASYFLSLGHIISVKDFIVVVIGQFVLFIIYFYFKSIKSKKRVEKYINWFQITLYLMVIIGTIQIVLYYLFNSMWGISHINHGVGLPRMSGLSLEPDWYGVICMMAFIFMSLNILDKKEFFNKYIDYCIVILSFIMLILSLTRAAWVALAVAYLFMLLIRINDKEFKKIKNMFFKYVKYLLPLCIIFCIIMLITRNPTFLKLFERLNVTKWFSNDGGAANSRNYAINIMMHYFKIHPITGNGVGSMNLISSNKDLLASFGYMGEINAGRGNANIIVTNLFDVGLPGTTCLIIFFILHIQKIINRLKTDFDIKQLAMLMILIGLLTDFQFNNGLRFAYVWIILGLNCAYHKENKTR